tara:strand:- start:168 stop:1016 length:849 start_codon:yes stop_codon:yes gene_type:complete
MRFFQDIYSLPPKTQALKPDSDSQPPARPISTAPSNPSESDRLKRAIVTGVGVSITQTYACSPFDVWKTYTQLGKKGPPLKPSIIFHGAWVNAVAKSGSYIAQSFFVNDALNNPSLTDTACAGTSSALFIHLPEYLKTQVQHSSPDRSVLDTIGSAIKKDPVSIVRGFQYTVIRENIFSLFLWKAPSFVAPYLPEFISNEWKNTAASMVVAPLAAALTIHADSLKTLSHIGQPNLSGSKVSLFLRLGRGVGARAGLFVFALPVIQLSREFFANFYDKHLDGK